MSLPVFKVLSPKAENIIKITNNNKMRLGTYSTIDAPTKNQAEALAFLRDEFEAIGGDVRQINNAHELAPNGYPSFEVDYPQILAEHNQDIEDYEKFKTDDDIELDKKKDDWHDQANAIERAYSEKFSEYL